MVEYTPRLALRKPARGELNWDIPLNENFDILDKATLIDAENCIAVDGLKLNEATTYKKKLLGDRSSNTIVVLATSSADPITLALAPYTSGNQSQIILLNAGDPSNAGMVLFGITPTEVMFRSFASGSGSKPSKYTFYDIPLFTEKDVSVGGNLTLSHDAFFGGNLNVTALVYAHAYWIGNYQVIDHDRNFWGAFAHFENLSVSGEVIGNYFRAENDLKIPTSAPSSPTAGSMYVDTTEKKLYVHDGTGWCSVALTPEY